VEGLRVVARTSAFQFKGRTEDVRRLGETLNVNAILEGSVRTAGKRLRVTAQLINVADGYHLWSERYDRDMEDVFAIQDDIARSIVDTLRITLVGGRDAVQVARHTEDLDAYHLYLRGRKQWYSRVEGGLQKAVALFQEAIEKDPSYALAYSGLADSYSVMGLFDFLPPRVVFAKARSAAERALALRDDVAEAHASVALIKMCFEWEWSAAERAYQRALELNPAYPLALVQYGLLLACLDRPDEALNVTDRLRWLDPLSAFTHAGRGISLRIVRRYEEAIHTCQKALSIDPTSVMALLHIGLAYAGSGHHEAAVHALDGAVATTGRAAFFTGLLGYAYALAGRHAEARALATELLERAPREYVTPLSLAWIWIGLQDAEKAFEWLERAYQDRSGWLFFAKVDPMYDPIRSDPRFDHLLRRMNLVS